MSDNLSTTVELTPQELRALVMDLQEGLAYLRAALGLGNDFPTYTRVRGQEVIDAITGVLGGVPEDEDMQEYLFEQFSRHIPHEQRVQIYSDSDAREAFLALFHSAPTLVAQLNALYFDD